jgi:hypothetical protein
MTREQRATYAILRPVYNAHLKFWDRACLVRFFNGIDEIGALPPKQTVSCKLVFEMLVPPFSHFALKTETARFTHNVEKPAGDDNQK